MCVDLDATCAVRIQYKTQQKHSRGSIKLGRAKNCKFQISLLEIIRHWMIFVATNYVKINENPYVIKINIIFWCLDMINYEELGVYIYNSVEIFH